MPIQSIRTEKKWLEVYDEKRAHWVHDGKPRRPHALRTGGGHVGELFNSDFLIEDPTLLSEAGHDLVRALVRDKLDIVRINRVVGMAHGATTLAHEVAKWIFNATKHNRTKGSRCYYSAIDKESFISRPLIETGEQVLIVEDVLSTGGTVEKVSRAIEAARATVVERIGVLVNATDPSKYKGRPVSALITHPVVAWDSIRECEFCRLGSDFLKSPKLAHNWARLNATTDKEKA